MEYFQIEAPRAHQMCATRSKVSFDATLREKGGFRRFRPS
jgi:hypothetical protein